VGGKTALNGSFHDSLRYANLGRPCFTPKVGAKTADVKKTAVSKYPDTRFYAHQDSPMGFSQSFRTQNPCEFFETHRLSV